VSSVIGFNTSPNERSGFGAYIQCHKLKAAVFWRGFDRFELELIAEATDNIKSFECLEFEVQCHRQCANNALRVAKSSDFLDSVIPWSSPEIDTGDNQGETFHNEIQIV
jgi:hypothetical protein